MRLKVERVDDDGTSTLGKMFVDGEFECWILEDTHQDEKVQGETRIPNGVYDIQLRPAGGMHGKYAARYDWHKGMLHLQDVPDFTYVYIHSGNYHTHTDGCILVGNSHGDSDGTHCVLDSRNAYDTVGRKITEALMCETVTIEVTG